MYLVLSAFTSSPFSLVTTTKAVLRQSKEFSGSIKSERSPDHQTDCPLVNKDCGFKCHIPSAEWHVGCVPGTTRVVTQIPGTDVDALKQQTQTY